ncbi:HD domain-containing protein [Sphingopyxis terrae]|uniref:HD domain-containing protein n=1 Tax=Sphingopyxis terrae TaxID=33052 RepID=UPI002A184870|nr:ATP-binding protein [Sphingopyxis terrae]MDX8357871.1 ATP-binding protein [Sphingopyxis terrae]
MTEIPLTNAERRAEEATRLPSLAINLINIRNNVATLLNEWKGAGFFREYTDHSYNHAHDMLTALDWIIPPETAEIMTPADWLMLVLSIYFHDIGLLVTEDEFNDRSRNEDFQSFIASSVLPSTKKSDYDARLKQMSTPEADRLQYQEFVRLNHGKRVRNWLEGGAGGDSKDIAAAKKILSGLLKDLDATFRRDLARICESHTLSNIDDTSLFKVSQPYGGENETVNLQYVAAILRTVDLLQITRSRTPSILFQLINPANPTSQLEWKKQGAVRAVRPRLARDKEGNVTDDFLSNTIEVHATFSEPEGFFGLTSYLAYAEKELTQTYSALQRSSGETVKNYIFPWRYIDQSNIDTEGFLTKTFEFELDQHKILDLLTGHTLYNNTQVVIRELTQNALDAVRLQAQIDGTDSNKSGKIIIDWDSASRVLTVSDNGTGMSQEMIENHLLKVGSSRYQDPKFKEKHPTFHSISRFGIGVLSAFMISDDIEITTCHPDDDRARKIALRSVHGKYLIKLLDKDGDRERLPHPHGTSVRLTLRPSAKIGNVLRVAQHWLMFPRCAVEVTIDGAEPVKIGFETPKEAIQSYLDSSFKRSRFKKDYKVVESTVDNVTVAFALAKDDIYEDWGFVDVSRVLEMDEEAPPVPASVCVEGVAVEQSSPGFNGVGLLAVANAVGAGAPKTNVARSALEDTPEQKRMLAAIYQIYGQHVSDEISRISSNDDVSLTRAVGFGPFIASPLTSPSAPPASSTLLDDAISKIPLGLVEENDQRKNVSIFDLEQAATFVTLDSPLHRSLEKLIKEAPADVTSSKLLGLLGNKAGSFPAEAVVCNLSSYGYFNKHIRDLFHISEVTVSNEQRELKLLWKRKSQDVLWISNLDVDRELLRADRKMHTAIRETRDRIRSARNMSGLINIPITDIPTYGFLTEGAFVSHGETYLRPGSSVAKFFAGLYHSDDPDRWAKLSAYILFFDYLRGLGAVGGALNGDYVQRAINSPAMAGVAGYLQEPGTFLEALSEFPEAIFDAGAWDKRTLADVGGF